MNITRDKHLALIAPTAGTASMVQIEAGADSCEVRCVHPESVRRGRDHLLPAAEYQSLAETFQALSDPSRAKIVYSLLEQELCTCDIAAIVGVSESAVSQHLNVLRRLRLVRSRREGKIIYHTLDDSHIRTLLSVCLEHVRDE
ncbi:MAG: ArsR family transcriptional regulator, lead/cadmium/zinc/bismuth-responsive transcriptional [Chloroflexia bacterium]|nr:ArsR family transcriptional regulator, lead/cadmium/zinc/bismuth-responsive transcriptional [Chloroflexia bacterium]